MLMCWHEKLIGMSNNNICLEGINILWYAVVNSTKIGLKHERFKALSWWVTLMNTICNYSIYAC